MGCSVCNVGYCLQIRHGHEVRVTVLLSSLHILFSEEHTICLSFTARCLNTNPSMSTQTSRLSAVSHMIHPFPYYANCMTMHHCLMGILQLICLYYSCYYFLLRQFLGKVDAMLKTKGPSLSPTPASLAQ